MAPFTVTWVSLEKVKEEQEGLEEEGSERKDKGK